MSTEKVAEFFLGNGEWLQFEGWGQKIHTRKKSLQTANAKFTFLDARGGNGRGFKIGGLLFILKDSSSKHKNKNKIWATLILNRYSILEQSIKRRRLSVVHEEKKAESN